MDELKIPIPKKEVLRCKFGRLIPFSATGCKTRYMLVDEQGKSISSKLRCGHGIALPHCKQCKNKK